ncbi:hypothetical protein GCM10028805_09150 [Spirosoma harenae]
MPVFASIRSRLRIPFLIGSGLLLSVFALAQINLTYRLLPGYLLNEGARVNKGKTTLFVFEQAEAFEETFKPAATGKSADVVNFSKETVIGVVLPPTTKPPKLSISKVFVQDSVLTVRYIRLADTTLTHNPLPSPTQPFLLLKVLKQTVLKTKLVENGKVVQIVKKKEEE